MASSATYDNSLGANSTNSGAQMNDELKEWIRILKFGLPSVIAFGVAFAGLAMMLTNPEYISQFSKSQLTGMLMVLGGIWFFWRMECIRLNSQIKELKKVSE